MHESHLAREILTVVLDRAATEPDGRIRRVQGWIAETETLSRESLAFHFAAHAVGTRADGAVLELRLIRVEARCGGCGARYLPEHHLLLCPQCGGTDAELLGQTGLGIATVEVG